MMNEEQIRSFIALDLDFQGKSFLEGLITRWKRNFPQAKWVQKNQLHVTLAFFSALPVKRIGDVESLLEKVGKGFSSFRVELRKIGVFPSWNRVRVLWVGFDQEGETRMKQINEVLIQGLKRAQIRLEEERDFVPHVTLARLRIPMSLTASDWKLEGVPVSMVERIVLFQSILTPQGPIYKELLVSHLKG